MFTLGAVRGQGSLPIISVRQFMQKGEEGSVFVMFLPENTVYLARLIPNPLNF